MVRGDTVWVPQLRIHATVEEVAPSGLVRTVRPLGDPTQLIQVFDLILLIAPYVKYFGLAISNVIASFRKPTVPVAIVRHWFLGADGNEVNKEVGFWSYAVARADGTRRPTRHRIEASMIVWFSDTGDTPERMYASLKRVVNWSYLPAKLPRRRVKIFRND